MIYRVDDRQTDRQTDTTENNTIIPARVVTSSVLWIKCLDVIAVNMPFNKLPSHGHRFLTFWRFLKQTAGKWGTRLFICAAATRAAVW